MNDVTLCAATENCERPAVIGNFCGEKHRLAAAHDLKRIVHENAEYWKQVCRASADDPEQLLSAFQLTSERVAHWGSSAYGDAFEHCLQYFWECQERGTKLTQRLNMDNALGVERSVKIVKTSSSDFCCDFLIAAKRSLSPRLFAFFDLVFVKRRYSRVPGEEYRSIRNQVGRMLVKSRVYPLHQYFKPVYL